MAHRGGRWRSQLERLFSMELHPCHVSGIAFAPDGDVRWVGKYLEGHLA